MIDDGDGISAEQEDAEMKSRGVISIQVQLGQARPAKKRERPQHELVQTLPTDTSKKVAVDGGRSHSVA